MFSTRNRVLSKLNTIESAGFPSTSTHFSNINKINEALQGLIYAADTIEYGQVAIKIVDADLVQHKTNLDDQTVKEDFIKERDILLFLNSKRSHHKTFPIVRAYESWDETDENGETIAHCLAMEFVRGRELFEVAFEKWESLIQYNDSNPLRNWLPSVRQLFREIVSAVEILHANGVVHLDLSPENILQDENGHICLIDFGTAERGVTDDELTFRGFRGKMAYAAIEVCQRDEFDGREADLFSLGAVLAFLLCGLVDRHREILQLIAYNRVELGSLMRRSGRDFAPEGGLDLIKRLVKPRDRRLTMEELKMDPYVMDLEDLEDGVVSGFDDLDLSDFHVSEEDVLPTEENLEKGRSPRESG